MVTQTAKNEVPVTDNGTRIIIEALDKLALALTEHHHQWVDEERRLYEEAISVLTT